MEWKSRSSNNNLENTLPIYHSLYTSCFMFFSFSLFFCFPLCLFITAFPFLPSFFHPLLLVFPRCSVSLLNYPIKMYKHIVQELPLVKCFSYARQSPNSFICIYLFYSYNIPMRKELLLSAFWSMRKQEHMKVT